MEPVDTDRDRARVSYENLARAMYWCKLEQMVYEIFGNSLT